jgi:hypothetical protein
MCGGTADGRSRAIVGIAVLPSLAVAAHATERRAEGDAGVAGEGGRAENLPSFQLLVVDPHYMAATELQSCSPEAAAASLEAPSSYGYIGWEGPSSFDARSWYNLCGPLPPQRGDSGPCGGGGSGSATEAEGDCGISAEASGYVGDDCDGREGDGSGAKAAEFGITVEAEGFR